MENDENMKAREKAASMVQSYESDECTRQATSGPDGIAHGFLIFDKATARSVKLGDWWSMMLWSSQVCATRRGPSFP